MISRNIISFFNKIFKRNTTQSIADVTKQNYSEYRSTYNTLSKIFSRLDGGIDAFLIGGISAPIQTSQDLYRQNSDIDIMCRNEELSKLIETLQKIGYTVEDRRGIKTRNKVNEDGSFQAEDHELNANIKKKNMLGVGIFTYQVKGDKVITHSYAFDEKEGRTVGTEKVVPKELFDLMYDSRTIDYKGLKLKTQSKEYIYMSKSKGSREKDKLDASAIEPSLDDESKKKMDRIRELETKTRTYRIIYGEDGRIESRIKLPTLEERVNAYLDNLFLADINKTPEQIIEEVLQSDKRSIIDNHPEINGIIKNWQEKTRKYTYEDKIKLLTKSYSKKLGKFSKEAIDNALDFLQQRYKNNGKNNDDIELSNEAKQIFELMQEYGQEIKKVFIRNNIDITHITEVSPEELEGGLLRKSIDRANNYETERVDGVFASSSPVDGNNPYIARKSSGMIRLGQTTYIYGSDNIDVTQDIDGKKHAILKQPNYVYYINPESFMPVCNITIDSYTHQPVFEFSQEWISDTPIDISDKKQVRSIEEVKDVTSLLEHYTILCDVQSQGTGMQARQLGKNNGLQYIVEKINEGSVRNINQEVGINDRNLSGMNR